MSCYSINKAIIIAAGLGIRLNPLTDGKPKCMLPVGGKIILKRQLDTLKECGINDIVIIRGYKKELIMEAFPFNTYVYNDRYATTNTAKSLLRALKNSALNP